MEQETAGFELSLQLLIANESYEADAMPSEPSHFFEPSWTLLLTGLVNLVSGRDSETLINYLDQNLIVLKEKLNETNFERILSVIWESSAQSLSDTIQMSIEVTILLMHRGNNFAHQMSIEVNILPRKCFVEIKSNLALLSIECHKNLIQYCLDPCPAPFSCFVWQKGYFHPFPRS